MVAIDLGGRRRSCSVEANGRAKNGCPNRLSHNGQDHHPSAQAGLLSVEVPPADAGPFGRAFVQAATESSSTAIDTAKLATKQSQDKDVKSFAHHMMVDHTKLTMQLKMATPHG